ncbi:hypothetical protein GGE65_008148 [Skermanella aerolata]
MDVLLREPSRKPGKPPVRQETVQRVGALTCAEPPGTATHWTGRTMAKAVNLSLRTIQRIWEVHRLQPHRIRIFKRSNDPALRPRWRMSSASTWTRRPMRWSCPICQTSSDSPPSA